MYGILVQIMGITNYQTNLTNYLSNVLTTLSLVSQWHKVHFTVRPIYRTGVTLPSRFCILYIFSTTISTEYFKNAVHSPFFSSKCRLFHNAIFFGSSIIHILHTGVLKFKCKI
jgi:hypothetical protein